MRHAVLWCLLTLFAASAWAQSTVQELASIKSWGESRLQGVGLVVGLNGTGDSGKEVAMARPLAEVLRRNGNPVGNLEELAKGQSVALVMVMCRIPAGNAYANDRYDVEVAVLNSATSLEGGLLYFCALTPPFPDAPVFALSEGRIDLENPDVPTVGRVRAGAQLIRDITMPPTGQRFELALHPHFSGFAAADHVRNAINDHYFARPDVNVAPIAVAVDERTVRITVPEPERADPAGFVATVLSTPIDPGLLGLPAQVVVNERSGVIVVTGDVEISLTNLTQNNLQITQTIPTPVPTPENPVVDSSRWATVGNVGRESTKVKLQDLLEAFKQLDIPVREQIQVLHQLHKSGRLHAKLIID